jgi:hypothetical protein
VPALAALVLSCGAGPAGAAGPAIAGSLACGTELRARLARGGRAEAEVTQVLSVESEPPVSRRARLALEPPDRVRLDFRDDGESLTLRGDGGEWLQPALQQLLLLAPDQVAAAARLWRIFLEGEAAGVVEKRVAARRFLVVAADRASMPFDTLWVTLGRDALPRSIETSLGESGRVSMALARWRFPSRRGASAFRLEARAGITTVPMR